MKPEYEQYRGAYGTKKEPASSRLPTALKAEAELIAVAENDSLTGLVIEGLMRVIEDRQSEPEYADKIHSSLTSRAQDLRAQLKINEQLLGRFTQAGEA